MQVKINKLASILEVHYKTKRPLLVIGPAGTGKTTSIKQFAKDKGVNLYEYRAAYCEPGDLKGLCNPDGDVMKFLRPEDFPPETDENCILFFDEINRASTAVMNCILQATDGSGRIATHKLPKGCLVVAAVNPDDSNHTVNSMDFALINRFNVVQLEYCHNSLIEFAKRNKWNGKVIGFLSAERGIFAGGRDYDGQNNLPTPRSLEYLSDMENATIDDNEVHKAVACGLLGPKIGLQYHAYATGEQPITMHELLEDTEAALKRAKKLAAPASLRADLLGGTNSEIVEYFKANETVTPAAFEAIVDWFITIPADLSAAVIKQVCSQKPALIDKFQAETKLMKRLGERLKTTAAA